MQAIRQTEPELKFEWTEHIDCSQVREKLDILFSGKPQIEAMQSDLKKKLFRHIETCGQCSRSFDARMRCNSFPHSGIY